MQQVRAADRKAQGATTDDERLAAEAIEKRQELHDRRLTVVHSQTNRTSCVTDQLDSRLGGQGFTNLLVATAKSVNFFGDGQLIDHLNTTFPTEPKWFGGNLPVSGYWGSESLAFEQVLRQLKAELEGH